MSSLGIIFREKQSIHNIKNLPRTNNGKEFIAAVFLLGQDWLVPGAELVARTDTGLGRGQLTFLLNEIDAH